MPASPLLSRNVSVLINPGLMPATAGGARGGASHSSARKGSAHRGRGTPDVPPKRSRFLWPVVVIVLVAVAAVLIRVLPASLITKFLPPAVHAEDFSGSVWHGSAGTIAVHGRNVGALEWHLHPAALLELTVGADVHWVKGGFLIDAAAAVDRHGFTARDIRGGGPLEDLHDFGVAPAWTGSAAVNLRILQGVFDDSTVALSTAVGDLQVSGLRSPTFAEGAELGEYALYLAAGAIAANGEIAAELTDTGAGGPLEAHAVIHFSPKESRGTLTGTLKERPSISALLRAQLDTLSQLHARDSQGRIPVDIEFTL